MVNSAVRRAVDAVLEVPIVTSFTSIGPAVRSRVDGWRPLDSYDLSGRTIVVTGATSGIGRAAAAWFARLGADLVIVGRDPERTAGAADELRELGPGRVEVAIADLGELGEVRAAAAHLAAAHPVVDVLVHNAGALTNERTTTSDGRELTVASQVDGPFLLTSMLLDSLRAAAPGRVLTMSSGGMYAAPLTVGQLEMSPDDYGGSEQYARAKRAQVTLTEMWAERVDPADVVFHSLHPGWADTPGVVDALPGFHRVVGPLLRDADGGADTLVWLAADDEAAASSGGFWHDRRRRNIHRLPTTRRSDTPERRARLWDLVVERSGADQAPSSSR